MCINTKKVQTIALTKGGSLLPATAAFLDKYRAYLLNVSIKRGRSQKKYANRLWESFLDKNALNAVHYLRKRVEEVRNTIRTRVTVDGHSPVNFDPIFPSDDIYREFVLATPTPPSM